MDNLFITIAVAVMYAFMLLASNRADVSSDVPAPEVRVGTTAPDTLAKPLFMLPDSVVTPDSTTTDSTK